MAYNNMFGLLLLGIFGCALAGLPQFKDRDGVDYVGVITPEQARSMVEGSDSTRILLGQSAPDGLLPWQVHLRMNSPYGNVGSCGGSIIHSQWVLTAAHCSENSVLIIVRMGISVTTPRLVLETQIYYNHPDYSSRTLNHDISLIDLGREIEFTEYIQPIAIQSILGASQGFAGLTLRASGFGLTNSSSLGGVVSETLNYVDMRGTTTSECSAVYGPTTVIYSTVCTMAVDDPQQSPCSGDSGGPLVLYEPVAGEATPRPILVGVICFVATTGCHTDNPAGYVSIGFYHPWLRQVTGSNFAS